MLQHTFNVLGLLYSILQILLKPVTFDAGKQLFPVSLREDKYILSRLDKWFFSFLCADRLICEKLTYRSNDGLSQDSGNQLHKEP